MVSFQNDCFDGLWTQIYEYAPNYRVYYAIDFNKGSKRLWLVAESSI